MRIFLLFFRTFKAPHLLVSYGTPATLTSLKKKIIQKYINETTPHLKRNINNIESQNNNNFFKFIKNIFNIIIYISTFGLYNNFSKFVFTLIMCIYYALHFKYVLYY